MFEIFRRQIHFGKRTYSLGTIVVVGAVVFIGGGAVYARLGGTTVPNSASNIDLQKGLVSRWKLDANGKDSTPFNNTGLLTGTSSASDRKGAAGKALGFAGLDTSNMIADNDNSFPTTALSVSFWVNGSGGARFMFSYSNTGNNDILIGSFTNLTVYIANTAHATGVSIPTSGWHHIVVTWQSSDGALVAYQDGAQIYSNTVQQGTVLTSGGCVVLAQDQDARCGGFQSTQALAGSMDDVRVYNRAVSSSEVTALYKGYDGAIKSSSGANSLIGWWKLDGGNAKDNTPYAQDGVLANSPTSTTDRKSSSGRALLFNGLNSMVTIADSPRLKYTGGNLTVSAWFQANATETTGGYLVSKPWNGSGGYNYRLQYTNTNQVQFYLGGTTAYTLNSTSSFATGTWHRATGVVDSSGNVKLYVDGQLENSGTHTITAWNPADSNKELTIGAIYPYGQGWSGVAANDFDGSIDDVRVYSRALPQSEIQAQYSSYDAQINLNTSPQAATGINLGQGLIGYWPFNGNALDTTPYSRNGTVSGALLSTDRKGRANSSYSFNGTSDYISLGASAVYPANVPAYTWSAWVKSSTISQEQMFLSRQVSNYFRIFNSKLFVSMKIGGTQRTRTGVTTMSSNTWYLATATYDGTALTLYLNGNQESQLTGISGVVNLNTGAFEVGRWEAADPRTMLGNVDDVRIWNRALSAQEVQTLATSYR